MTVELTPEQYNTYIDNGFTHDDIKNTIDTYRSQGMPDSQIYTRMNTKYRQMAGIQDVQTPQIGDQPNYDDIINNPSLTPQQAAQQIQQKGEAYRSNLDQQLPTDIAKNTLQGYVNNTGDFGKGLLQGVSSLGVGLGKNVVNPLRADLGKQPLTDEQLNNLYGVLAQKPTSLSGQVGKGIGEVLPYLFLPEATLFKGAGVASTLGNLVVTGAYQGALANTLSSLANKGISPDTLKDMATGAGTGALLNVGLGSALKYGLPRVFPKLSNEYQTRLQKVMQRRNIPLSERYISPEELQKYIDADEPQPSQFGVTPTNPQLNKQIFEQMQNNVQAEKELMSEYRNLHSNMNKKYGSIENLKQQALNDLPENVKFGTKSEALDDYQNLIAYENTLANAKYVKNNILPSSTRVGKISEMPTVGEAPIQQVAPNKFNIEADTNIPVEQTVPETQLQQIENIPKVEQQQVPVPQGQLNNLNPTGTVFTEYNPSQRATAKLGENLTTYDKTAQLAPEDIVTIYRGVPKNAKSEINAGDFITTNKQLAKDYAGDGKVIEKKVKASDIVDDAKEPLMEEYIYRPSQTVPEAQLQQVENIPKVEQRPINEFVQPNLKQDEITGQKYYDTKEDAEDARARKFNEWATQLKENMDNEAPIQYQHFDKTPLNINEGQSANEIRTSILGDTGVNNLRAAAVQNEINKILPNKADREALAMTYRYANNTPAQIQSDLVNPDFAPYKKAIEKSLNPTPEMVQAKSLLDNYFREQATIGQEYGILDNLVDEGKYLPQMWEQQRFNPYTSKTKSLLGTRPQSANERVYDEWRKGILQGETSKTEDVSDLLGLQASQFNQKLTNKKLISELEASGVGRWVEKGRQEPNEVQLLGMERQTPIVKKGDTIVRVAGSGAPLMKKRIFVVPYQIQDAIEPLMSEHFKPNAVYNTIRKANGVLKANIFGGIGSPFHALNITKNMVASNLTPMSLFKYGADKASMEAYVRAGGKLTTSDIGADVMQELSRDKRPLPQVLSVLFNNPVTKATNDLIFKKYIPAAQTALWKQNMTTWISRHPNATEQEIKNAARTLAEHSNNMGGFANVKAMGMPAKWRDLTSQLMLAFNWNASKALHIAQIFQNSAGGNEAKKAAFRGIIYSSILGNLINELATGHPMYQNPDGHKFDIMWGKDSDVFTSVLMPAQEDIVKTYDKMFDKDKGKGIIGGGIAQIMSKKSPVVGLTTSLVALGANRNYFGGKIVKPEDTQLQKLGKSLGYVANQNMDVPIGFQNAMRLYGKGNRKPSDYALSSIGWGTVGTNPANKRQENVYKTSNELTQYGIAKDDKTMQRMNDFYSKTGSRVSLIPEATKTINIGDTKKKLTDEEYQNYKKTIVRLSYNIRKSLLSNKEYDKMNTAEKIDEFKKINSAVGQAARIMLFKQNPKHINRYTRHILDNYDKYSKED